eukprot:3128199-Amphidinium_carterae.1
MCSADDHPPFDDSPQVAHPRWMCANVTQSPPHYPGWPIAQCSRSKAECAAHPPAGDYTYMAGDYINDNNTTSDAQYSPPIID